MKVLIDNGHGLLTPGKTSPDGRLKEWAYTREIATAVADELSKRGIDAVRIVPEDCDVSLQERARRVNALCRQDKCVLISIHVNAAGGGASWRQARGWTGWVCKSASGSSCRLARLLFAEAEKRGLKGNRYVPADRYWTANFYILRHTACPAVLTENLFQDNKDDVDFLLSDEGKQAIVSLHVDAIVKYLQNG